MFDGNFEEILFRAPSVVSGWCTVQNCFTVGTYWMNELQLYKVILVKWEISDVKVYFMSFSPCYSWTRAASCRSCVWQRTWGQTQGTSALCSDSTAATSGRVYCSCSSGPAAEVATLQQGLWGALAKMVRRWEKGLVLFLFSFTDVRINQL